MTSSTTCGITSFGAFVPRRRLQRAAIAAAHAWAFPSLKGLGKGERSMCGWDEDAITMAVEAGRDCLRGRGGSAIASLTLASTTAPYADLNNAMFVGTALRLPSTVSATEAGMLALLLRGSTVPVFVGPTESDVEALRCKSDVLIGPSLPRCGDGVHDAVLGEACDPPVDKPFCAVGEATCLVCSQRCTLEPGVANVCGDGQVTADEACDGMPRRTCEQLGFDFGTSKCSSVCAHDTSECVKLSRCDPVSMRCDPEYPALPPDDAAACVLGSDGLARCWGHSPVGHHLPPRTVFSQVADGPGHACGLGAGGSVSCWGDDSAMQSTPAGGPYVKVVVGDRPSTDGALADALGWPFALVLSGVTASVAPPGGEAIPDPAPPFVDADLGAVAPALITALRQA